MLLPSNAAASLGRRRPARQLPVRQLFIVAMLCAAGGLSWRVPAGAGVSQAHAAGAVAPLTRRVDFVKDVAPILQENCAQCHANGRSRGDLHIDTRADVLKGGESNSPAIVPGHSDQSELIDLVAEKDPAVRMPKKGRPLTADEVGVLRAWIDQGAEWPANYKLVHFKQAALEPRCPVIPKAEPGSGLTNSIDLILQPYFTAHGLKPGAPVDDRVYARRIYLDVVGLLPTPAELDAFVSDAGPDKRPRLVERLLEDHRRYAEHWMTFWNDLLRNDYQGAGYIDGGRTQITSWLFKALDTNVPYDQFVRELVQGTNGAAGFTRGIVWRGVVNASQTPQMQAAQGVSQVFMGVNLKCASCHDSFVSEWKLTDSYGLAAIYADGPLEMQRCDHPLGKLAPMKFLYDQLGSIDTAAPRARRLEQLAAIVTSEKDGRLTRTVVNRLWQRLMGRGLIEPCDEMDNDPWNADVLDELAAELADHHYDLKRTLATILESQAYQQPAVIQSDETDEKFVFRGPLMRRMTAEQFVDAVSTVTGVPMGKPVADLDGKKSVPKKKVAVDPKGAAGPTSAPVKKIEAADARAVLCPANPLTTALGRPSREQVVTERSSAATTLQGLEMTNGRTLADALHGGAIKYLSQKSVMTDDLVRRLYTSALGRDPTAAELQLADKTVGQPATAEGMEDLMWAVVMLPEFQLIR